ncbi:DUF952 domain-containing protein [Nakamurella sp. YIM 132087]|uniref:DUF952 domain-containing protein n=1 Tax=Nakamurella alba TaxID=2665158 RepID=A0A7K1FMQ0_9ACTN|nr:DUF952 domain-containing protein [Nakamurella alba]MTD14513.1 DUF952 domain-containing protein [Nakamurella alba]
MRILHLAGLPAWSAVTAPGATTGYTESTRGMDLAEVGFLHASTSAQLPGVIDRFYADVDLATMVVLVIDVDLCEAGGSPVRWDPVGDQEFPHIYGPLPVAAVVATLPPIRDADGGLAPLDLTGLDVA